MNSLLQEIVDELNSLDDYDREQAHINADACLILALRLTGHDEVADAYEKAEERIRFYYA